MTLSILWVFLVLAIILSLSSIRNITLTIPLLFLLYDVISCILPCVCYFAIYFISVFRNTGFILFVVRDWDNYHFTNPVVRQRSTELCRIIFDVSASSCAKNFICYFPVPSISKLKQNLSIRERI